ncbi:MAG: hypothetical protein WC356_04475 [Candidatus Micrarchaeia archaeon]|jgi:hypothetical protein
MKTLRKSIKTAEKIITTIGFSIFLTISPLIAQETKEIQKIMYIEYEGKKYSSRYLICEGLFYANEKIPKKSFEIAKILSSFGDENNAFQILNSIKKYINDAEDNLNGFKEEFYKFYAEISEKLAIKEGNSSKARKYWHEAKESYEFLEDWDNARRCSKNEGKCYE